MQMQPAQMFGVPCLHPAFLMRQRARMWGLFDHAVARAVRIAAGTWKPNWTEDEFIMRPSADAVVKALRKMEGKRVAYDVETDGRHPLECTLRCVAFYDGNEGICIPFVFRDGTVEEVPRVTDSGKVKMERRSVWKPYFTGKALEKVVAAVKRLFASSKTRFESQNGQYDRMVLGAYGFEVPRGPPHFDTIIGHHIIASYLPHGLNTLAALYTECPYYKQNDDGDAWSSESDMQLWRYNIRDVKVTWLIAKKMREEVTFRAEDARLYEHDAWQEGACEDWKRIGILLSPETLAFFRQHYRAVATRALDGLKRIAASVITDPFQRTNALQALLDKWSAKDEEGVDDEGKVVEYFNPGSLIQLRALLIALGVPLNEVTATGQLSTAKEFLTAARKELLERQIPPDDDRLAFLDYLFAWRESTKVESTYLHPEVLRDGRVHPTFSMHVVPTGRLSSKGPNCFSGDTELLTPSGWQRIDKWVTAPGVVAQWHEGNKLSWTAPRDVIVKDSSDWVHITNEHIDLLVTGEHRCPVTTRKGVFKVVEARDYPEDCRQLNAVDGWLREEPGFELSDDCLRLLIAVQADGSWNRDALDFTLVKPRKVERLRGLLTSLGLRFSERLRKPDSRTSSVATRFYVPGCATLQRLKSILGEEKRFGPWLLGLNATQRTTFMEEVMLWDGCATRMNHYASEHRSNADWVQTVFILSGRRANTRVYQPGENAWGTKPSHQVDVSTNNYSWTTNRKLEVSTTPAPAYCLSVPSSFVLVRRNGKVMVSGQCQNQPAEIRGMFIPRPGHILVYGDWDALEMRLAAYISGDPELIKVFADYDAKRGPKPHIVNMSVIFGLPATKEAADQNPGMYRAAKVFAYAVAYGAGDQTVFEQVREELPDMSWDAFQVAIGNYRRRYKVMFDYFKDCVKRGTQLGFLDSAILKRRVYFFERGYGDGGSPEASAMQNMPMQSGGADVVSLANYRIMKKVVEPMRKKLKKGEVIEQLAQVHDELLFEVPKRMAKKFAHGFETVAKECPAPGFESWYLPVEVKSADRWKPVQTRCRTRATADGPICGQLVNVEPAKRTKTHVHWEGTCEKCKQVSRIDVERKLEALAA